MRKAKPKPRIGKCLIYHGYGWTWAPAEEWIESKYLARHGREKFVGSMAQRRGGEVRSYSVWLAYEGQDEDPSSGAPLPLYIAQEPRKRRR